MSATARPVSMTWDGAFEEEEPAVFQPENFMYLGPGTYNDVSPLAEEEEEAARRLVAGGIEGRVDLSPSKGVSPLNSERTTPAQGTTHAGPINGEPVVVPSTVIEEVYEMPGIEPPPVHDPVGVIAEMPTYDTAQAHIETHPPPIEMADNTILAPIETAVSMMAELPDRTSPTDKKKNEPQLAPGSLRNYGAQMQPLRIAKPVEDSPGFQTYKPEGPAEIPPNPTPLRRATFQPREPLANLSPIRPPDRGHAGTPNVLSPPQVPPKRPLDEHDEPSQPQLPPKHHYDRPSQSNSPPGIVSNGSSVQGQQPGLSNMPSILKPARGKAPGQQPAPAPARPPQGHGYVPPAQGKHPPSMTPAPQAQQKRLEEPRMGVQRVNTVPDSLPSQRPQSTIQTGHQRLPQSTVNLQHLPKRPVSVMPDMMGGQPQGQMQSGYNSNVNLPYRGPVENLPPSGLPRSATAGPSTPFPPYPVDNLPYPDDEPIYRREDPPYPEEPFVQKPMPPRQSSIDTSFSPANNRRHSSYSSAIVSPDSRHGSISFPLQTPSPMEHSRRASSASATNPNYTPSPVSHSSPSVSSFSPTPPSAPTNQHQQGSYFTMQDVEGQGHNIAARDVLRKQSLSRGADARRSSVGADPASTQRGSPLSQQISQGHNTPAQVLPRQQQPRQISQDNAVPQNQPPVAPTPPPQGQQGLGRIEEYEEATSANISRSSTTSIPPETRRGSMVSSAQPSPAGSRRASWQAESPKNTSPSQSQMQQGQIPHTYTGQTMPPGQAPGVPVSVQNAKQLQRKPSQGHVPQPQPQSQQIPARDPRIPQGMLVQQGPGPGQLNQGQMVPTQAQGQSPHPGQTAQNQNVPPGPAPQGFAPKPVPTRLQKRSSYGPPSPAAQNPPPNQFLQGTMPPQMRQNPMAQQGSAPGQVPPLGHPQTVQIHPGQIPNGRVQPQVQIPQGNQGWQPIPQPTMPQSSRPVSMQPQSQSAGAKEGKEGKKWLKWLKGGSKSVSHSPTTPVISSPISPVVGRPSWGGGEYSQQAVWQPGQPPAGTMQAGFQGNMAPRPLQIPPQPMQVPQPGQALSPSVQTPSQYSQIGFQSGQPLPQTNRLPPQPSQMSLQSGQVPSQTGQLPHINQLPPQAGRMPPQAIQQPPQGQVPPQTGFLPQKRQSPSQQAQLPPQQESRPPQVNHTAPITSQVPLSGPLPVTQHQPQSHPAAAHSVAGPSAIKPANLPSHVSEPYMAPPARVESSNAPHQEPTRQPSPTEPQQLQQGHAPQLRAHPPQPPQTFASNTLQPQPNIPRSASPPQPAVSPGLSDIAASSISRVSSCRRDSFSDAGSITTIEVAQAQPQPVLKPSIVQVHRRSTDLQNMSQKGLPYNGSQSSSDVTPRISAENARAKMEPTLPTSKFQQKQPVRPEQTSQFSAPANSATTASLSSDSNAAPKFVQPSIPNQYENKEQSPAVSAQQNNDDVKATSSLQSAKTAPAQDKWAKKPVVDYSGGDWGDDDDWEY
jgi:hypothetical protein